MSKKIDKMVFPGMQGGPMDHIIAAKAVAFHEALQPEFKDYCGQIIKNAKTLAEELEKLNFKMTSGGTDNHLILIDITRKDSCGKEAETVFEDVGIYTNKNMIPCQDAELPLDSRGKKVGTPFNPRGIRIGTPALKK